MQLHERIYLFKITIFAWDMYKIFIISLSQDLNA